MTEIRVSDGRVCIIKAGELDSVKEGLEAMKKVLIDFTTSDRVQDSNLDTFLFVDLSPFNIINSSLIGIFGSIIMDRKIQLLGLCGLQPAVEDILKRFGVITEGGVGKAFASDKIKSNLSKVMVFKTMQEGLACLNPD
ncbi:MAG: STAS domain-containing protein [Desulfobulbaceae bacterium]|nr:MAG: STAS domain-containing protein [Desulfobulbaceae bacterium]